MATTALSNLQPVLQSFKNYAKSTNPSDPNEVVLSRASLGNYDSEFVKFWRGRGHKVTVEAETINVKLSQNKRRKSVTKTTKIAKAKIDRSRVVNLNHDLDDLCLSNNSIEIESYFGECVLSAWKRVIDDASLQEIAGQECNLSTLLSTCFLVGKITGLFCSLSQQRPSFFQVLLDVNQDCDDVQKVAMFELVRVQERSLFMSKSVECCFEDTPMQPRHRLTLLKYALANIDAEHGDFDDALQRLAIANDRSDIDQWSKQQERGFALHVLFYWHALVSDTNEAAKTLLEEFIQTFESGFKGQSCTGFFRMLETAYRNCVEHRSIIRDMIENAECHLFMRHVDEFGCTDLDDKFTLLKYHFQHKIKNDNVEEHHQTALSDYIVTHLSDLDPVGIVSIFENFDTDSNKKLTLRHVQIILDHFCVEKPWIVKTLFQNYRTTMPNSTLLTKKERQLIEHYLERVKI